MKKITIIFVLILLCQVGKTQFDINALFSRGVQIGLVTIDTSSWHNMVVWQKINVDSLRTSYSLNLLSLDYFIVYRWDSASAVFDSIDKVSFSQLSAYVDNASEPWKRSYKYKLGARVRYRLTSFSSIVSLKTRLDSCRYHKSLFIKKIENKDTFRLHIEPYVVEKMDITKYLNTLLVKIYRNTDSTKVYSDASLYDTVYYNIGDTTFSYVDPDTSSYDSVYYYLGVVDLLKTIDPAKYFQLKASAGPFSQSVSNLEDNRLKEEAPTNSAPTNISLSANSLNENLPAGTFVAKLSVVDADPSDLHQYSLVSGTGDNDNASFTIAGDSLKTTSAFDFETKSTYSIRTKVAETNTVEKYTFEKAFTISVTDVTENPIDNSINNNIKREGINIYPLPLGNQLTIDIALDKSSDIRVSLINLLGQLVYGSEHKAVSAGISSISEYFSNAQIKDGMYLLQIEYNDIRVSRKILVQRRGE